MYETQVLPSFPFLLLLFSCSSITSVLHHTERILQEFSELNEDIGFNCASPIHLQKYITYQ